MAAGNGYSAIAKVVCQDQRNYPLTTEEDIWIQDVNNRRQIMYFTADATKLVSQLTLATYRHGRL
jgi:hypothetical protein